MATIRDVYLRVNNFEQYQEKIIGDCIDESSETILDANRDQMLLGLDKEGNKIIPPYTPFTRERKIEKKRNPDIVTLYDEGDFHKSMFLKNDGKEIMISSNDSKTDELMIKYNKTDTVLGIPNDSKTKINETIMDKFIKIFRLMTKL